MSQRVTKNLTAPAALAIAGVLALTAACSGASESASPSNREAESTSTPSASSTPTPAPAPTVTTPPADQVIPGKTIGTPDKPYAPGESFSVLNDWTFTVGATDTDTWPDVAANFPNDIEQYEPGAGMTFVSVPITMTYVGPHITQDRVYGFAAYYISLDGGTHFFGTCGRYGTAIDAFKHLAVVEMPSEEGVLCAEVPQNLAAGGQWRVSMYYFDEANREHRAEVYYALS